MWLKHLIKIITMNKAKFFVSHILLPVTIFVLLSVAVFDLLVDQAKGFSVRQEDEGTAANNGGVLRTRQEDEMLLDWAPYYTGGSGLDNVVAVNGSSLRVSSGPEGEWYGAISPVQDPIGEATSISFSTRFSDWDNTQRVMILLFVGDDFSSYYHLDLKDYFTAPANNEWRTISLDRSAFSAQEESPDWSKITHIAVRVESRMGSQAKVWFDDFQLHYSSRLAPRVTMAFDDGYKSVVDAKKIMDKYEFEGSLYVVPELLGTDDYLTQNDVDMLALAGWDISGHSSTSLLELDPVALDTELALVHKYLTEHEYQGSEHFAYPGGAYNESVQGQVLEYFESARSNDGLQQPPEHLIPQNINAIAISNDTPVTEVITQIDEAVENGLWLILVWHDLDDTAKLDNEYNLRDFEWIVSYLNQKNVKVSPYSEVYESLSK